MATKKKTAKGPTVTIKVSGNPKMEESSKFETIAEIKNSKGLPNYTAAVNGEPVDDSYELQDGDWISFSPEVKGGAPKTNGVTLAMLTKKTNQFFKGVKPPVKAKGKAALIAKAIEGKFGCHRNDVRRILEVITGLSIPEMKDGRLSTPIGVIAVVVDNKAGHNIPLGKTVLSINKDYFNTASGSQFYVNHGDVRKPTAAEIAKLDPALIRSFNDRVFFA